MPSSATTEPSTLSLHDALPIFRGTARPCCASPYSPPCPEWAAWRGWSHPPASPGRRARGAWGPAAGRGRRTGYPIRPGPPGPGWRSEEHTSELQSHSDLVCRLLRPPSPPLFPYTTLFRSFAAQHGRVAHRHIRPLAQSGQHGVDGVTHQRHPGGGPGGRGVQPPEGVGEQGIQFDPVHQAPDGDRKSTRLNSSHTVISYAVFCDHRALHSFPTRRSSDLSRHSTAVLRIAIFAPLPRVGSMAWMESPTSVTREEGQGGVGSSRRKG